MLKHASRRIRYIYFICFAFAACLLSPAHVTTSAQEDTPPPAAETAQPTALPNLTLTIWLPEPLVSADRPEAMALLNEQTNAFVEAENGQQINLDMRVKRVGGEAGSLMPTLRSASAVAPGALPDVALLRRSDLLTAQRNGLIQPLETLVPSATLGNLGATLPLGQINGELLGLPYMVDLLHMAYRPDADIDYSSWAFDAVLEREQAILLPAGSLTGLNEVTLLQYLTTSNNPTHNGRLILDDAALRTVLNFYERAGASGLISDNTLSYLTPNDYLAAFSAGDVDNAVLRSTTFLRLLASEPNLQAAPIPTANGRTTALLDGWMWVLVASDSRQQDVAVRYIAHMMTPERQAAYADRILMLPSQRSALRASDLQAEQVDFYLNLLENALLPPETEGGPLARQMQEAVVAIISGESSAEAATAAITQTQEN